MIKSRKYDLVMGNPVIEGSVTSILFVDNNKDLAQDGSNLVWSGNRLGIGTSSPDASLHVGAGIVLLDNNQGYGIKDTGGTIRNSMFLANDNILYFGPALGTVNTIIRSTGSETMRLISGNRVRFGVPNSGTVTLSLANSSSANLTNIQAGNATSAVTYTLPTADGATGQYLSTDGAGILSWASSGGGTIHNILSATHGDTTTGTVVRGDLITGQGVSPTWNRLAISTQNSLLRAGAAEPEYWDLEAANYEIGVSGSNFVVEVGSIPALSIAQSNGIATFTAPAAGGTGTGTIAFDIPIPPKMRDKNVRIVSGQFGYAITETGTGDAIITDNRLYIVNPDDGTFTNIDIDAVDITTGSGTHAFSSLPYTLLTGENPAVLRVELKLSANKGTGIATIQIRGCYFVFDTDT